jgi:cation/acetate symporter
VLADGSKVINGAPASKENQLRQVGNLEAIDGKTGAEATTGSVGPFEFLAKIGSPGTQVRTWKPAKFDDGDAKVTAYYPSITAGSKIMRPGQKFKVEGTPIEKLDFISLMLALFLGTAALPHILIRYYTVPTPAAARKSTIVAIAAIGFFYVLTLYMGLGAMVNAVVNPADNNMSGPLLAKSFGPILFAVISAIAFATVLGTVAGLIVAASGAVAHDVMDRYMGLKLDDRKKVRMGKIAAFVVGIIAIILGILFQGVNVTFLVGLAFAVAASANLPSIIMLLFWKRTTPQGIVASILVGITLSIGIILFSPDMYELYGKVRSDAPIPFANPGLFSIPMSFLTLVVVSLMTAKKPDAKANTELAVG